MFDIPNFVQKHYLLNRVWVSADTKRFTEAIRDEMGTGEIYTARSGEEVLTWIVPPAWEVEYGHLKNAAGETLVDFADHPLHLIQYSGSFEGELTFDELKPHLHTEPGVPDGVPYLYVQQYDHQRQGEWGFALSQEQYDRLDKKARYRVEIKTRFSEGDACVYDFHIPGQRKETIFFAAHTCHPGQVNDGIACIALIMDLFQWIQEQGTPLYSYRMIIGPEYLGAAVFLAKATGIEDLAFGYFLDMMVHSDGPLEYSQSFEGNTLVDFVTATVLQQHGIQTRIHDFRQLWGNDEMFYDGPDYEIPVIGLGRPDFRNYHTSRDDMRTLVAERCEESRNVLRDIVRLFEKDLIAKRNYRGPLYLSRHNLYIPTKKYPDVVLAQQKLQRGLNGKNSLLEIAQKYAIDPEFCYDMTRQLLDKNLAKEVTL